VFPVLQNGHSVQSVSFQILTLLTSKPFSGRLLDNVNDFGLILQLSRIGGKVGVGDRRENCR
jgi:hypothetical protein